MMRLTLGVFLVAFWPTALQIEKKVRAGFRLSELRVAPDAGADGVARRQRGGAAQPRLGRAPSLLDAVPPYAGARASAFPAATIAAERITPIGDFAFPADTQAQTALLTPPTGQPTDSDLDGGFLGGGTDPFPGGQDPGPVILPPTGPDTGTPPVTPPTTPPVVDPPGTGPGTDPNPPVVIVNPPGTPGTDPGSPGVPGTPGNPGTDPGTDPGGGGPGGGDPGGGPGGNPPTAPIPEPASWLMMILGFALIGSSLRLKARVSRSRP